MPNIIYGLHESGSSEIRYVGKSCDLQRRIKEHESSDVSSWNRLLHLWISSVKASGSLCATVLEENPPNWRVAEITWMRDLRHQGHRLLNSAPGGQGPYQGSKLSDEHKRRLSASHKGRNYWWGAKISAALKGRIFTEEWKRRMSEALKGRTISPETRAKLSAAARGKVCSPETRARLSASNRGKHRSLETRARMSSAARRRANA